MCGIAGYVGKTSYPYNCLGEMAKAINHRGPDDRGTWYNEDEGIGLAHARLSILDLSSAGHQPMHSVSKNFVLVFNGEIYNHKVLRSELELIAQRNWLGHSDTETLLVAIDHWGLEKTLKKAKGMFAIALWDKRNKNLSLACDRIGEKPLYYGWVNDQFVFASELKSIKKFPEFKNLIDRNSLALFLRFNSIPAPHSIYQDIYKLEPSQIIQLNADSKQVKKFNFWSTEEVYNKGNLSQVSGTPEEIVDQLEVVLSKAVSSQMQSDVPLGAFLSGGIDSSTIVALMQSQSDSQVNTFTIGFNAKEYDEAKHARMVANHIGTNHFEMYVNERDALDIIPNLPNIYDEPFADSSQIPTYLVSKFAKQEVTVALSGDAGDELFGGYNRYVFAEKMFSKIMKGPISIRQLISSAIFTMTEEKWNALLNNFLSERFADIGHKLHKVANVLPAKSIRDMHFKLVSQIQNPSDWLLKANEYKTSLNDDTKRFVELNPIEQMMAYDLITYLPTDILTKVDRAAMAVSLETRVPFLDLNVIEFSASLPMEFKIRNGVTKWALREVLYKHVPKDLIERPKMGFGVPLAEWLRGPLQDWAESLLDEKRLHQEGFFDVEFVRNKWLEHLSGKRNWHHQLWNVLMFQAWLEKN
ncbi:asparagine synthase (glutamine-hydrolyzing) [Gammaproteobacteria bacterium]|nr:asparagine synthase (glutamine-hydrolyzing) [Gammaproteobacteria bacterium]